MLAQLKNHLVNVVAAPCERRRVVAIVKHGGHRPPLQTAALRLVVWIYCLSAGLCSAQTLSLPPRPPAALTGTQLATNATLLSPELLTREAFIEKEILSGNVPNFLRKLSPVTITDIGAGGTNIVTIYVTPDYLALGSDEDYLLMPMTPATAQRLADATDCLLPTRKMSDAIYASADVKLPPQPLPPGPTMTTVPVFVQHNDIVRTQRAETLKTHPLGALVAGDKKDVVITPRLAAATNKVAIYGWHRTNGVAIQPLYLGHTAAWVDYSHGTRLVSKALLLTGRWTNVPAVLADTNLCSLLSDEGPVVQPRYSTNFVSPAATAIIGPRWPQGFVTSKNFGELTREFNLPNGVRIVVNTPPASSFATNKPVQLIFFALPNGNTIEQTIGKQMQAGYDWHFNIQHIGAQTRFLRNALTNQSIVVAYLENSLKSWPAWRRTNGNDRIPALFDTVRNIFADYRQEIVLTGHSGGGSLTFGYLNAVEKIPGDIKRIAFLDSNYAYETTNHFAKLTAWLRASDEIKLCVLAYHDSIALLDGKTFVSERGGTWGRSHAMLEDLRREFHFTRSTNSAGLQSHVAANGRIQLLLKENPEKKILHTVQVDRNGFIHAMLTGTPLENIGYEYFGERAYERWIQGD
jgi:hypothetical protein